MGRHHSHCADPALADGGVCDLDDLPEQLGAVRTAESGWRAMYDAELERAVSCELHTGGLQESPTDVDREDVRHRFRLER